MVGECTASSLVQQNRSADAVRLPASRRRSLQPSDWMLYSALGVAYDQQSDTADAPSSPMTAPWC